ncbi:MAG: hypothetical protein SFY66_18615 [Oculatellaceae cyanobacterium bins.114]|nr:hypothetical protein [Oculatellaceae cyanobacterium bins.114]
MIDLLDTLTSIQIHITRCQLKGSDPTPRLVAWAIVALVRKGREEAQVRRMIGDRPLARQWWMLRQLLSDKAIAVLEEKLRTAEFPHEGKR